jgi:STE24 endopeptidase
MSPAAAGLGALVALAGAVRIWLAWRQIAHLRGTGPAGLHAASRARAEALAGTAECIVALGLAIGGGIAALASLVPDDASGGAFLVAAVVAPIAAVRAARDAYVRLVVDARHALDRARPARVLRPLALRVLALVGMAALFGAGVIALRQTGLAGWWVLAALVSIAALWLGAWLSPLIATPLSVAVRPFPEGALEARLIGLAQRCGIATPTICLTMTSTRSKRANARVSGVGRTQRIELSDNLLAQLVPDEIAAVVAHELGHWRGAHRRRELVARMLGCAAFIAAFAAAAGSPTAAAALGLGEPHAAALLAGFVAVLPPLSVFTAPLANRRRRRFEHEADAFAARHADAQALARALRKLHAINLTPRSSDAFYGAFFNSHPELGARLQRLRSARS